MTNASVVNVTLFWFFFISPPSFPLGLSFSVRPSSGWFCPHALCLHAQQPTVPSTHGTISFLPLLSNALSLPWDTVFPSCFIHTRAACGVWVGVPETCSCYIGVSVVCNTVWQLFGLWQCWSSSWTRCTNEWLTACPPPPHTTVTGCNTSCKGLFFLSLSHCRATCVLPLPPGGLWYNKPYSALYHCLSVYVLYHYTSVLSLTRYLPTMWHLHLALNRRGWSMRSLVSGGLSFLRCDGQTHTHICCRRNLLRSLSWRQVFKCSKAHLYISYP